MDVSSDRTLDWEELRRERQQLQQIGQRIPYISFALIHVALAFFLVALFLVDHFALDAQGKLLLRIGLVVAAILLLAVAWSYAIILSRRFKHVVLRWSQMEVAYAQQEQLNQFKDQFLTHVSHEMRTPLTEMYGYLELLSMQDAGQDAEMQLDFVAQAKQGCSDLIEFVTTILDAMQVKNALDVNHEAIVPVAPLIRDVLASFSPQETDSYDISVAVADEVCVWASEQAVRQVLRNLLSNAFKYCPAGAAITVTASQQQAKADNAIPQVCLCVCDTGPGIPPAEQSLLFQRFMRLQRDLAGSIRGSGLGLFICKQLVESMGGRIWVESSGRAGEGSRFCFLIPNVSAGTLSPPETYERHSTEA